METIVNFIASNFIPIIVVAALLVVVVIIIAIRNNFIGKHKSELLEIMKGIEEYANDNEGVAVDKMALAVAQVKTILFEGLDMLMEKNPQTKFLAKLIKSSLTDAYIKKVCQSLFDVFQGLIEDVYNRIKDVPEESVKIKTKANLEIEE